MFKNKILKEGQETTSTSPEYIDMDTGRVFTPASIITSKSKKGKLPKRYKAHSMSERVGSPSFGSGERKKRKKKIKKLAYGSGNNSSIETPSPSSSGLSTTEMGNRGSFIQYGDSNSLDSINVEVGELTEGRLGDPNKLNPPSGPTAESSKDNAADDEDNNDDNNHALDNQSAIDKLVRLADLFDQDNIEVYANFTDFLIKKFAQVKSEDSTDSFNNLILKVKRMDIPNTNEVIKKLTKIYSRTILLEYGKDNDLEKSKKSAYTKTLHRANQYLSEV